MNDQVCTGVGPSKKLAKRNAAEAMLQHLGYSRPSPQPAKPAIKSADGTMAPADKKVTFIDHEGSHGELQCYENISNLLIKRVLGNYCAILTVG